VQRAEALRKTLEVALGSIKQPEAKPEVVAINAPKKESQCVPVAASGEPVESNGKPDVTTGVL